MLLEQALRCGASALDPTLLYGSWKGTSFDLHRVALVTNYVREIQDSFRHYLLPTLPSSLFSYDEVRLQPPMMAYASA
jgi:hypothetical protein